MPTCKNVLCSISVKRMTLFSSQHQWYENDSIESANYFFYLANLSISIMVIFGAVKMIGTSCIGMISLGRLLSRESSACDPPKIIDRCTRRVGGKTALLVDSQTPRVFDNGKAAQTLFHITKLIPTKKREKSHSSHTPSWFLVPQGL